MTVLVIGGGGIWAAAGLGVFKALRDMGIKVDGFVGVSAGALMGGVLALGYSPEEVEQWISAFNYKELRVDYRRLLGEIVRGRLPRSVLREDGLWCHLEGVFHEKNWDSLQFPLWVVATSLTRARPFVYGTRLPRKINQQLFDLWWADTTLDLKVALKASMAVPGLFEPVISQEGELLVDGGILDDYPVDVAEWVGADRIIGVWIDEEPKRHFSSHWNVKHLIEGTVTSMIRDMSVIRQQPLLTPRVDIRLMMSAGHSAFQRIPHIIRWGHDQAWSKQQVLRELFME